MKKLHLVCNAHLDPVWMWDFDEGIAAALSTFRAAADFCDEFDYVFCHNEAQLYEYVEEQDAALFERIRTLVKCGKWHIMGGWYLQPDCQLPSGESFVRQIAEGNRYFMKKFGVKPTTAINFDSFGHTRGLVQILKKCGYDSYLICRPMPNALELPDNQFNWIGYDGSRIKCCRIGDDFMYCTDLSQAKAFIPKKAECWKDHETGLALWGVGNHGGGPSRIDLRDTAELIEKTKDYEMLHSTPEAFFADIAPEIDYDKPLSNFLVGCYTSLTAVKQAHIKLENELYYTEKICSVAELNGKKVWDEEMLCEAQKALLTIEFHDSLSGTMVQTAEASVLARANHGLYLLSKAKQRAFFAMTEDELPAAPGSYPIFVYNPAPFDTETAIETEFLILSILVSDEKENEIIVTHNGEKIKSQIIKELSNINYDRRKRVAFKATLPAMSFSRFDVNVKLIDKKISVFFDDGDIVFKDSIKQIKISKESGLIESYIADSKEYAAGRMFLPVAYDDSPDPWGWDIKRLGENPKPAVLDDCKSGIFEGLKNVRVIEQGDILTEVEALFSVYDSKIRLSYKLYRDLPYIDISADVFWNEQNKALKLMIPTALKGRVVGQQAYGTDEFYRNGEENIAQRFLSIEDENNLSLNLYNNCIYGVSADTDNLYLTLLRGIAYCAHPIGDRPILQDDRFIPFAEQGKHRFEFRMSVSRRAVRENEAIEFCQPPYALNAFPCGKGDSRNCSLRLSNNAIALHALYKRHDSYFIRLFNNNPQNEDCEITVGNLKKLLYFIPYEIKTILIEDNQINEQKKII